MHINFPQRFLAAVLLAAGALAGCSAPTDDRAEAQQIIRGQVASDIDIRVDDSKWSTVVEDGRFRHICGEATLNRPGTGPLAMNNKRERFIVTMSGGGAGAAEFDGSSDAETRAAFEANWRAVCR